MQKPEGFKKAYINFSDKHHLSGTYSYHYDGIWAVALALNRSDEILRQNYSRSLKDFNYNDSVTMNIIQKNVNILQFTGVSVSCQQREMQSLNYIQPILL